MERWNGYQSAHKFWESRYFPDRDVISDFKRMLEEVEEAKQEASFFDGSPESRQALGEEMADIIISSLGVITQLGLDVEGLLEKKLTKTYTKYPVEQ